MKIMRTRRWFVGIAASVLSAGAWAGYARGEGEADFSRWEKEIAAFERKDAANPPPKQAILFAGSSSIRLWDLKTSFPDLETINRGFGGSQIIDSVHFAPRIILKHRPKTVVLFAGDNDLAAGKSAEQVVADFRSFVRVVHKELPETRILFIAVKPSLKRWKLADEQRKANALVKAYCDSDGRLGFVDVFPSMLGEDGTPRADLFRNDGLHLNAKGYELWTSLLRPALK
jgi:lysophospholipase L1-like esterase